MNKQPQDTAPRIDLTGAAAKSPAEAAVGSDGPATRMTMDELARNYDTILKVGAIYYPVAYRLMRTLGKGRQGVVFLGLRQGARGCITEHAIKIFDPRLYRSPEEYWTDMGRIAAQISQLQRLQSPNLVQRHVYEETYGLGYVEMESIDGMDLRRFLSKDHLQTAMNNSTPGEWSRLSATLFHLYDDTVALQPGLAVYILRSILRGLERLHEMNFLHSDVKPGNIMIDRLGYVRLVDFGRAVIIGEKLSFLIGSPLYMAPEIHRREPGGPESDLYSVGLVALEMLRGRQLAEDEDISEDDLLSIKMSLHDRLDELLPRKAAENRVLVSIFRRLLDPDPAARYATAKSAESGGEGFGVVDKQLVHAGLDSEYGRDLADYLSKLVHSKTDRVEMESEVR